MKQSKGFTLIEILIVIGIIAVLAAGIIIALNPGRRFAQTRDTQRVAHLNDILKAIMSNISENQGKFVCGGVATSLPSDTYTLIATGTGNFDLAPCLVPTYTPRLPVDPSTGVWVDSTNYNTGYYIWLNTTTQRIFLRANGELQGTIEVSQ